MRGLKQKLWTSNGAYIVLLQASWMSRGAQFTPEEAEGGEVREKGGERLREGNPSKEAKT